MKVVVYWCPICKLYTQNSWHSLRDGGLFPQNDTEHECIKVNVTDTVRAALAGVPPPEAGGGVPLTDYGDKSVRVAGVPPSVAPPEEQP